jgi:hydrogenase maturation protein HypF
VAALAGGRQEVNYEAQAAIEFEAALDRSERGKYDFKVEGNVIRAMQVIVQVTQDEQSGAGLGVISARFHNGLAALVLELASQIRDARGLSQVALSGGVWQNIALLERTRRILRQAEFEVLTHRRVPTNDGGVALGQAAIAARHVAMNKL